MFPGASFTLHRGKLTPLKPGVGRSGRMQIRSIRICAMSSRPLSTLRPGDRGTITAVHGHESLGKRLTALGFSIGRPLQLLRQAGWRGPLHVRLGTTDVALRPAEAAGIAIRLAEPERA